MPPNTMPEFWSTGHTFTSAIRGPGDLMLSTDISPSEPSQCVTYLGTDIYWTPEGGKSVKVGMLSAWVVDKTLGGKKGRATWVRDLVTNFPNDELDDLRKALEVFFNDRGSREYSFRGVRDLVAGHMVYVDKLLIHEMYRDAGFGGHALDTFHKQLTELAPHFSLADAFVFLQPDFINNDYPDHESVPPGLRAATIRKLRTFYGRHNYALLYQEEPGVAETEGTYTLMGRKLTLAANTQDNAASSMQTTVRQSGAPVNSANAQDNAPSNVHTALRPEAAPMVNATNPWPQNSAPSNTDTSARPQGASVNATNPRPQDTAPSSMHIAVRPEASSVNAAGPWPQARPVWSLEIALGRRGASVTTTTNSGPRGSATSIMHTAVSLEGASANGTIHQQLPEVVDHSEAMPGNVTFREVRYAGGHRIYEFGNIF
ncbi:hypothetical protein LTR62_000640 [Meristemomyces frigidus]|uniref:Uncharacterized protein n=1 Tax=Meristemomyces frigidus TaxID=1508187 RepID=A0AAN7T926_9PEZI|nr:hypothetical protein LTR62_000640 [Meristemomyces frigidus]